MPKGRIHAPSTVSDGIWFGHRGLPPPEPLLRTLTTTTGVMLNAPFDDTKSGYPPIPPVPYTEKDARNFKVSNNFSAHDNRHSFQDHGVYLEDGRDKRFLGKRLTAPTHRQHSTDKDYLKHNGRTHVDYSYNTVYGSDYAGSPTEEPPSKRRFPRIHKDGDPRLAKLTTTTTDLYRPPDVPHKTPLHVLAISQEPFLPDNRWRYSYHGRSKCYPKYDKVATNRPFPLWAHKMEPVKTHQVKT